MDGKIISGLKTIAPARTIHEQDDESKNDNKEKLWLCCKISKFEKSCSVHVIQMLQLE